MLNYSLHYDGNNVTASASDGQTVCYTKADFRMKLPRQQGRDVNRLAIVQGTHLVSTYYGYSKQGRGSEGKLHWINQGNQRRIFVERR